MTSGTLYTYPDNFRAQKALIAAKYSGATLTVSKDFVFGETNKSPEFLKKFPLGKVPAFEGSNGVLLTESNAIAYYVANEELRGGSDAASRAQVVQWMSWADNEVLPASCTWVFPTMGIMQFNKSNTERAKEDIKVALKCLNDHLLTKTFLVGERLSLADIAVASTMLNLYKHVLDPAFRKPFGNVNRWFTTVVNQPNVKGVIGAVTLAAKMAEFDSKKYAEFSGKGGDKKVEKKKQEKPKQAPKKAEKKEEKEEEAPKMPEKKKDPLDELPKGNMDMDEWKRFYSNNEEDDSIKWFWEHFDSENYSIWRCDYKYNDELTMVFMSCNLIGGMFQSSQFQVWIKSGALLACGIVNTGVRNECDPALALLSDYVLHSSTWLGAIFGLGLVYAGSKGTDVVQLLLSVLHDSKANMEVIGVTISSFGLIAVGSSNDDVTSTILQTLIMKTEHEADFTDVISVVENPSNVIKLPIKAVPAKRLVGIEPNPGPPQCILCFGDQIFPAIFDCGHAVCWSCCVENLRQNPECPMCQRTPASITTPFDSENEIPEEWAHYPSRPVGTNSLQDMMILVIPPTPPNQTPPRNEDQFVNDEQIDSPPARERRNAQMPERFGDYVVPLRGRGNIERRGRGRPPGTRRGTGRGVDGAGIAEDGSGIADDGLGIAEDGALIAEDGAARGGARGTRIGARGTRGGPRGARGTRGGATTGTGRAARVRRGGGTAATIVRGGGTAIGGGGADAGMGILHTVEDATAETSNGPAEEGLSEDEPEFEDESNIDTDVSNRPFKITELIPGSALRYEEALIESVRSWLLENPTFTVDDIKKVGIVHRIRARFPSAFPKNTTRGNSRYGQAMGTNLKRILKKRKQRNAYLSSASGISVPRRTELEGFVDEIINMDRDRRVENETRPRAAALNMTLSEGDREHYTSTPRDRRSEADYLRDQAMRASGSRPRARNNQALETVSTSFFNMMPPVTEARVDIENRREDRRQARENERILEMRRLEDERNRREERMMLSDQRNLLFMERLMTRSDPTASSSRSRILVKLEQEAPTESQDVFSPVYKENIQDLKEDLSKLCNIDLNLIDGILLVVVENDSVEKILLRDTSLLTENSKYLVSSISRSYDQTHVYLKLRKK